MTPMPIVDLFIRRLALPTVNCALHFALECSREVARIVFHFLNPQDGLVRSHRLQEILREIPFFFFCISYWPNSTSSVFFRLSVVRETSHKPTVHSYIFTWSTHSFHHTINTYDFSGPLSSHWHEQDNQHYSCHLKILLLLPILHQWVA